MADIFTPNGRKDIPKKSPSNIVRIDMTVQDIGGRKSHTKGTLPKNDMSIDHVGKSGS
jgi:hypothetical protein